MMLTTSYRSNACSNGNRRSRQRTINSNSGIASLTSLYILVAFVGSNIIMGVHGEECGQEEFTKCAEPLEMLHLTSEFSIGAAKKDELDKLCNELRKGVRCIQSYTRRCMPLQQRNQFNKLYHGTNQFIRDLCNEGDFQDEYLKHAPCSEMAKKEFEVCANRYKETMLFLKPNKNQETHENITLNENIKTICCSINELVDCSEDAARKICGPEAAKFTRELVDKYANSLTKNRLNGLAALAIHHEMAITADEVIDKVGNTPANLFAKLVCRPCLHTRKSAYKLNLALLAAQQAWVADKVIVMHAIYISLYCEDFTRHPEMCHDGLAGKGVALQQTHQNRLLTLGIACLAWILGTSIRIR